ncbi:hypothetical protein ACO1O0_001096 [Amphichorda felina]
MASISESRNHVPAPAYKISKDYPQMLTVQWAKALGDNGFTVVAISLGAIPAIMELVVRQNKDDNGMFLDILELGFGGAYSRRYVPF